jgi:hypothetical protein
MKRVRMKRNDYENVSKGFIGGPPAISSLYAMQRATVADAINWCEIW